MILTARRAGAYLIDCLCIMAYAGLLFLFVVFVMQPSMEAAARVSTTQALQQQAIGLIVLTLPVVMTLAWMEAGRWQGTLGKRLLGLRVMRVDGDPLRFSRSLGRNALKFLPWEIAHTGVNQTLVTDHPLPRLGIAISILSMVLVAVYLVSCLLGRGRTIYDRLFDARIN